MAMAENQTGKVEAANGVDLNKLAVSNLSGVFPAWRILLVEDDDQLARSLVNLLRSSGHAVDHVATQRTHCSSRSRNPTPRSSSTWAFPTSTASRC